jgi:hypothetical protein
VRRGGRAAPRVGMVEALAGAGAERGKCQGSRWRWEGHSREAVAGQLVRVRSELGVGSAEESRRAAEEQLGAGWKWGRGSWSARLAMG